MGGKKHGCLIVSLENITFSVTTVLNGNSSLISSRSSLKYTDNSTLVNTHVDENTAINWKPTKALK